MSTSKAPARRKMSKRFFRLLSRGARAAKFLSLCLSLLLSGAPLSLSAAASPRPVFFDGPTAFTNAAPITINSTAAPNPEPATPYPSNINVTGMTGVVSNVTVRINNLSHTVPDDLDMLLVSPSGQNFHFWSDVGGFSPVSNVTVTVDDAAASPLPESGPLVNNTSYRPFNSAAAGETFPAPAPAGPYNEPATAGAATFAVFDGVNPNGNWSLYVTDDIDSDSGSIAGGWTITITTAATAAATTTTVTSSPNPSQVGQSVTFTATVTSTSTVNEGTVLFREGATNLTCTEGPNPRPVSGGTATCTVAAGFSAGNHTITADYNGTANFLNSSGTVLQQVTSVSGSNFCNPGSIAINSGAATPYPSNILVSGLSGTTSNVTLNLNNLSHPIPDDIDMLLVSPTGQKFIPMSDVGGTTAASNVTLTLSDAAASLLPDGGPLVSGTFRPTAYAAGDTFAPPAPGPPYAEPAPTGGATFASTFAGANPNGVWNLYIHDDIASDNGTLAGGWCVNITAAGGTATTTTVTSSQNPSFRDQPVTFTATVTDGSNPVTVGDVTFKDGGVGGTNLSCTEGPQPRPLNGSGQATCTVAANGLSEGSHTITAVYNGSGPFATSNGSLVQVVNNPTVVNGNSFCNQGPIAINSGAATPYPSNIFVSGLAGGITKVTLNLNNLTHPIPDDVDVLLVGPGGQNFIPMSDVGGTTPVSNVTLVLDDAAASPLPDGGPLVSGTFRPADYDAAADTPFPAPAPAPPYNDAAPAGTATFASVFNGANPNGTWSLYIRDDIASDNGTLAGGWCVNIEVPASISIDDVSVPEPTSGSTVAPFTVKLSAPQSNTVTVNFQTADNTAMSALGDYTPTSGTLTFNPGETFQTISVPVLADGDNTEVAETFFVNLSGATGGATIADPQGVGTITPPGTGPGSGPPNVMISELRTSGPGGAGDEFVELYNNTDSPIAVGGWSLVRQGSTCSANPVIVWTIPGATNIPARGHYLVAGPAYSLANYGGPGAAAGNNGSPIVNIPADSNIALFSTSGLANLSLATRLDAVGFATNVGNNCDLLREGTPLAAASGSTTEHTFARKITTGKPQDTNSNAADFWVLSTTPATPVGSTVAPLLGAPGPENLASPLLRTAQMGSALIAPCLSSTVSPNRVRDSTSYVDSLSGTGTYTLGTLVVRRRFTNNTGQSLTRLRYRIVDITAFPSPAGTADMRAISSANVTVSNPCGPTSILGTTLEQPPPQPNGGALNSTYASGTVTTGVPLAPGATIDVQFLLGVRQSGGFRFFFIVEALP